ncbi:MAG: hypothetical protein VKO64_05655 [Candidatus Sericytochromatia bacterium]|nr:hypothetical protein [Candidatus Sericytochromatia bacterium]
MAPRRLDFLLELAPGGDARAPGGAVTCALCGHWDHPPPCRWPHETRTEVRESGLAVTVTVTCPDAEWPEVAERVRSALVRGEQAGPDGRMSCWAVVAESSEQ